MEEQDFETNEFETNEFETNEFETNKFETNETDIELLVDTLRQCFGAEKARYYLNEEELIIEISGLASIDETEISEISESVLEELDPGYDEVILLDMKE